MQITRHMLKYIGFAATCGLLWTGLTLGSARAENIPMAADGARIDWDGTTHRSFTKSQSESGFGEGQPGP